MADPKFNEGCAWIGGDYVPINQAAIPITDTGFTRSDVTYDVVSVWNGKFFRLQDHLDRFERGWQKIRMTPPLNRTEMSRILNACVAKTGLREAYVEMIVTRGVPLGGDRDPRNFQSRFYAFAIPYVWIAQPEHQAQGINLIVANSTHRIPSACVDPTVKNFQWGDLVQGLFEAYDRQAYTAVLLDAAGNVTEGPGFNVFAYRDGHLLTAKEGVLEGITRATVIELAAELEIPCVIDAFDAETLRGADEIFLTTTAGGVMPVRQIDGKLVGNGTPGPISRALREAYWEAHERATWSTAVLYESASIGSVA